MSIELDRSDLIKHVREDDVEATTMLSSIDFFFYVKSFISSLF